MLNSSNTIDLRVSISILLKRLFNNIHQMSKKSVMKTDVIRRRLFLMFYVVTMYGFRLSSYDFGLNVKTGWAENKMSFTQPLQASVVCWVLLLRCTWIMCFSRKDLSRDQREYKKKKAQKKAQRFKQMDDEREQDKNKWIQFNAKVLWNCYFIWKFYLFFFLFLL